MTTEPFGPLVVIANPRSGGGKVGRHLPEIERILTGARLTYRVVRTAHPGHATEIARDALARGERYLVAAGGDGTVHEVVNGMLDDGQPVAADAVLGVVAAGSGMRLRRGPSTSPATPSRPPVTWPETGSAPSTWAA